MLGDIPIDDGLEEQNATLRRLAEVLDIAPTAFFDAPVDDLSQTTELLRLWQGITDTRDRAKVMSMVRTIASHP
ncbi:hypothetical protein MKK70_13460 [Methylobacterium sp. E-041]|uniref:hypothetical protein n=1 Tax=Methylobacterium sp. E-041 TaxID=2836573 RepID=UPI001FB8F13E|nr:hypothetical protein [Methylobacterium sp. E-041]MCJ2106371.1 hypothetical protein [Methylobacterium sp. E-041]